MYQLISIGAKGKVIVITQRYIRHLCTYMYWNSYKSTKDTHDYLPLYSHIWDRTFSIFLSITAGNFMIYNKSYDNKCCVEPTYAIWFHLATHRNEKKRFDNPAVMHIDFYSRMYYTYFIAIQIILPAYLVELIYSKLYQLNLHNQMLSDSYLNFLLSFNIIL